MTVNTICARRTIYTQLAINALNMRRIYTPVLKACKEPQTLKLIKNETLTS